MDQAMVVVVFILGILLIGVAMLALLKGLKGEKGEFEAFGIKLSGTGGSLFLVVGVVLPFSAKNWNDGLVRKAELARAVGQYQQAVQTLTERSRVLEARLPAPVLVTLKTQNAQLFTQPQVVVPRRAMAEVQRFQAKGETR